MNNVPIYNPTGRYWVKLYHMGKLRKIEIDDLMPCTKYEDFMFPKCENLEELWPALLTKALCKLYSYRHNSTSYIQEEIGDCAIIYSLTGYIGETISLEKKKTYEKEEMMINLCKNLLRDECYFNKQKILLCYHKKIKPQKEKLKNKDEEELIELIKNSPLSVKRLSMKNVKFQDGDILNLINSSPQLSKKFKSIQRTKSIVKQLKQKSIKQFELEDEKINLKFKNPFNRKSSQELKSKTNPKYKTQLKFSRTDDVISNLDDLTRKEILIQIGIINNEILELSNKNNSNNQNNSNKKNLKAKFSKLNLNSGNLPSNRSEKIFNNLDNEKMNNIYTDSLYSILDILDTNNFNMKRLKPIDFSYLKQKMRHARVSYKTLPLEEKKVYVQTLLELKSKQKDEKMAKIEEFKIPGENFLSIKIKNNSIGAKNKFNFPYTEEEIEMTKKCLINNWEYPPISFLDKIYQDRQKFKEKITENFPNKSHNNSKIIKHKDSSVLDHTEDSVHLGSSHSWNKDVYLQLIENNLDQYDNAKELNSREKGDWILMEEFSEIFNHFLILHNPKFYKNEIVADCNYYNFQFDIYEMNQDFSVFYMNSNITHDSNNSICSHDFISNSKFSNKDSSFLLKFSPNNEITNSLRDNQFYIIFDLLDKNGNLILENIKLFSFYMSFQYDHLDINTDYYLVLKGGLFPLGFHLQVYSDHKIENISYFSYMKKVLNFSQINFKLEHQNLEKKKLHMLMRLVINNNNVTTNMRFSIRSVNPIEHENYLKQFLDLFLVNKHGMNKKIYFSDVCRIEGSDEDYYIILTFYPPVNLQENNYNFELVSDNINLKTEMIEHVETYEVTDFYMPNRHGIVFKELIFVSEKVYSTLSITLRRNNINKKNSQLNINNEGLEIKDNIRMFIELYNVKNNNELILKKEFFTNINLLNLIFEGIPVIPIDNKKQNKSENNQNIPINSPYLVVCYLDMSEMPEYLKNCENGEISWVIRVNSSDTIGFVKDTSKEELEKSLKGSWEITEPGRSDKAKKSRTKFLILQKKNRGEKLSNEELSILNEERERKVFSQIKIDQQIKKENKNEKKKLKEENIVKEPEKIEILDFNKPLPKPEEHNATYIKNFIGYAYKSRTVVFDNKLRQEEKLLIDENTKNSKSNEILEFYEQYEISHLKDLEEFNIKKSKMDETLKSFYQITTRTRFLEKENNNLLQERDELNYQISSKKNADKKLIEIINLDKKETFDLNSCIQSYNEIKSSGYNSDLLERVHNLISKKKEEMIKNEIKKIGTNLKEMKSFSQKILEDIKINNWKINEEILKSLINN